MASATKEKTGSTSSVVMSQGYMTPGTTQAAGSYLLLPRCTMKVEKQKDGCKITCSCDDQVATYMLQNLCRMLEGGVCGFTCQLNGQNICCCTMSCGHTSIEMTKDGCCITCTSGDAKCCELIQKCCDCLKSCMDCGCTCCMTLNNTPICCCVCI